MVLGHFGFRLISLSWVGFGWDWLWARLALSWVKWIGLHGAGLALGLGQISFGPGVGFGSVWYCAGLALGLVVFRQVGFLPGLLWTWLASSWFGLGLG